MPSIPATNSHLVSLSTATDLTTEFRSIRNSILQSNLQNQDILPLSETFNVNDVNLLIGQTGCAAMRIYYGMDENSKLHAVLVAVNEDNEDILPSLVSDNDDIILEEGQRCPVICPSSSPLNS